MEVAKTTDFILKWRYRPQTRVFSRATLLQSNMRWSKASSAYLGYQWVIEGWKGPEGVL